MDYTIHHAKTQLSKLIAEACEGKEVIIARGDEPVVKLVPIGSARKVRVPGKFAGQISYSPDAFAPLTDRELEDLGLE